KSNNLENVDVCAISSADLRKVEKKVPTRKELGGFERQRRFDAGARRDTGVSRRHSINRGKSMKVSRVHVAIVAALTGAGGLGCQSAALAQELEEIVVTATRREQNRQEMPISIVAVTGEGLELRGLQNVESLNATIPNLSVMGAGVGTSSPAFRVRGIPGVGTYVDGIFQVSTAGMLTEEFVDIDRLEVLRG